MSKKGSQVAMKTTIFGLGLSGISAAKYALAMKDDVHLVNQGDPELWEIPESLKDLPRTPQKNAQKVFLDSDRIIISPGIDPYMEILNEVRAKNISIISEIDLAYQNCHKPIIAVTGTNGKTTCVRIIEHALKSAGKRVFVGGNIGTPFCDYHLEGREVDYCLLELSSFQLQSLEEFRADAAVILNITPSHQERHPTFEHYQNAKLNIFQFSRESDYRLVHHSLRHLIDADTYSGKEANDYDWTRCPLKGDHRLFNYSAAMKLLSSLKLSIDWQQVINEFSGVEHRLEYLGKDEGFKIFNDAKSSNIAATCSALKAFRRDQLTLIIGGLLRSDKVDWSSDQIQIINECQRILLIGSSSDLLIDILPTAIPCQKLESAVLEFKKSPTEVLLLSPAFPSFDQFKNYIDRGEQFKKLFL